MKYLKTYKQIINEISNNESKYLSNDGKTLNCANNKLSELPELPKILEYLYCDNNKLTKLPELPKTLKYLYCSDNNLTELPELPQTLKYLDCDNNKLTELPELPKTLEYLYCPSNNLPYDDLKEYWEWFYKENPDLHQANKLGLY